MFAFDCARHGPNGPVGAPVWSPQLPVLRTTGSPH